jgi:TonB family protein
MRSAAHVRLCVVAIVSLAFIPLHADESKDLQKHLHERLGKKVFFIRNFYGGNHLIFDSQGNLIEGAEPECWCAAAMEVRKIDVKKDVLTLRGPRVVGPYRLERLDEQVQLDIKLNPAETNEESITAAIMKVLITSDDELERLKPEIRKEKNGAKRPEERVAAAASDVPYLTLGKDMARPEAISSPDPDYTDVARKRKRQGDVVLGIVIDETGHVAHVNVVRCLGAGLDEAAVQAVSGWRFKPARKNGNPVPVQVNVDVNFHLW